MATRQQSELVEQDQQQFTEQSSNNIHIIPYQKIDGEFNLSDELVASVFRKMLEQDLYQIVFWEGKIQNTGDFVGMLQEDRNIVQFVAGDEGLLAVAWLNNAADNYAFAHFCMFREAQLAGITDDIARMLTEYWFSLGDPEPILDILIGIMPDHNRMAHNFVERVGWVKLGKIPGMFKRLQDGVRKGAVIYYATRLDNG